MSVRVAVHTPESTPSAPAPTVLEPPTLPPRVVARSPQPRWRAIAPPTAVLARVLHITEKAKLEQYARTAIGTGKTFTAPMLIAAVNAYLTDTGSQLTVRAKADLRKKDVKAVVHDEDVEALEAEIKRQLKGEGKPDKRSEIAEQAAVEFEAAKATARRTFHHHTFKGDFATGTDTPTGYHSTVGGSTTHEAYGARTELDRGTYQRSVKGRKSADKSFVRKPYRSTFWPDGASEDEVITAIASVGSGTEVKKPDTLRGIPVTKTGGTMYPATGRDTPAEALPTG